jgi:hypothetical protein
VSQNSPINVLQRHSHVTDSTGLLDVRIIGVQFKQIVREMDESSRVNDLLAGCPGDIDLIILDPLSIHPEGKGAKPTTLLDIFSDPGAVGIQRFGKIFDEGGKKTLARLIRRPLEDSPEGCCFVEPAQGARYIVCIGHRKLLLQVGRRHRAKNGGYSTH